MRWLTITATAALIGGSSVVAIAGLLAGRGTQGPPAQAIASITPAGCSFTAGTQNGAICDISVTMSPGTPDSTAALTLTGTNSGGFHLVGAGCANATAGTCTIQQSTTTAGTAAGTYTDVSAVATQSGIANSPFTQPLTLSGTNVVASTPSLLHVSQTNPRYFATQDGQGVYLTGNHTWTAGINFSSVGPFSFNAMVDYMTTIDVNFIRYWATWMAAYDPDNGGPILSPLPFNRSGTCCANGGGNKFNLSSFNQAFFDKIKSDVEYAAANGMYVMLLLFNPVDYTGLQWSYDYWNGNNNTNGTTTDYATAIEGGNPTLVSLQQAYLRKFLDTLAAEPNVLYEIANELGQNHNTTAVYTWQEGMASLIHSYESAQGYLHHPVGIEYTPPNNSSISTSPADFIIPYDYLSDAAVFGFGKPSFVDSDHYFGIGGGTDWWWRGFTNGNNMLSMDDMEFTGLTGNVSLAGNPNIPLELENRVAIKQTRALTKMMDMTGMVPRPDLSSTGSVLADTSVDQYIVWAGSGGTITVNLSADSGVPLTTQWLNTADGTLSSETTVTSGSNSQSFTSPFGANPAALVIVGPAGTRIAGISLIPPSGAAAFTDISMSGTSYTSGTASNIGTASASVSSGTSAPAWSFKTSGLDTATGTACHDYSAYFSVNSSTGVVSVNTSAPAQNYPGTCLQATQSVMTNSPYSKAFTFVGNSPISGNATILPTPPAGKSWVQTFNDDFNSFNTSVWDVDHYGGSSNATTTTNNGILTITIDTNYPDTRTIIDTWTTSGGSGNHAFAQRYGYFVYNIKLPTCSSGEYDVEFFGRDQWPAARTTGPYAEMALASGQNTCNYHNLRPYQSYDGSGFNGFSFMPDADVGVDVTLAFHQYGLLWVNDGSPHGSVTMYFDGVKYAGPEQLLSSGWDVGLFFDLYWSPEAAGTQLGGNNGIPDYGSVMQVDWVRAYQLQ